VAVAPEVDKIAANFILAGIFRQKRFNLRSDRKKLGWASTRIAWMSQRTISIFDIKWGTSAFKIRYLFLL
jgi:hypothetical protein